MLCSRCQKEQSDRLNFCGDCGQDLRTARAAPEDPWVGRIVDGRYRVLEIIGRGGMGVVHRARQVQVGHEVALKRIRAGELATDEEVARFVHEARTASRLSHPNIVRIYHVEEHEGRPFFTMELLDGSLDRSMDRFREPRTAVR